MRNRFKTFKDFYPFYLSEHTNTMCRILHFIGTGGALIITTLSIINFNMLWLYAPLCGYSFAWVGHFIFEKNKPATFKYPLYSLAGDFLMFFQLLIRKEKFNSAK